MSSLRDLFQSVHFTASDVGDKLLLTLLVVVAIWLLRWLLVHLIQARVESAERRYRWSKNTAYLGVTLSLAAILVIWVEEIRALSTFLGLLAAGLAIALKDLVTSFAGWIFILTRKPFEVGDRIQIGEHKGDVIDIRAFKFALIEVGGWVAADQSSGRVVHLPNSAAITEVIVNDTHGFPYVWNEIPVLVTYESDWRRAKSILEEIVAEEGAQVVEAAATALRTVTSRYLLHYSRLTPKVYSAIADSGVLLTIRHLCLPRQRRDEVERISEAILERFGEAPNIDLAYPTERRYTHSVEGKPEMRPKE